MDCFSKINNIQRKDNFDYVCLKKTYIVKPTKSKSLKKVFLVHGHDIALKEEITRVLEKQGIEVVLLDECMNAGLTIFLSLDL